jgi:hypothetical protein
MKTNTTKLQIDATAVITAAFMGQIHSKGEFTAETLFNDFVKDSVPAAMHKRILKRVGGNMAKYRRLGYIEPTGRVVQSTRENHCSQLIQIWRVKQCEPNSAKK